MASISGPLNPREGHHPILPSTEIDPSLEELVSKFPEKLPAGPTPFSGVLAVQMDDGAVVKASHCANGAAFDPDRPFNVLSVGKLFTAVAVMQLIEQKIEVNGAVLSLDTPLSDLLTEAERNLKLDLPYIGPSRDDLEKLNAHADRITVKHLLAHTAGFLEEPLPPVWKPELVGIYEYSNFGYQLLAIIIGKYSKVGDRENPETGFKNHVIRCIFEKAEMEGALREIAQSSIASDPARFDVVEDQDTHTVSMKPVDPREPEPLPHGNGCWRMKANDLLLFAKAMRNNSLITADSFKAMLEEDPPLGFMIKKGEKKGDPIKFWGHPGHGPGMSADLCSYNTNTGSSRTVTTAILSNTKNGADLAHELFAKKFDEKI